LAELEAFYEANFDILGTAQRATETAIEETEANLSWMNLHYDEVSNWLRSRQP